MEVKGLRDTAMASTSPTPLPSDAPLRKRRVKSSPLRVKNAWLIAAIVVVFLVGVVWSGRAGHILSFLYKPLSIVLIVVLTIEYILLKGRDRTRIYKIEVEKMQKKRDDDIELMRNLERELIALEKNLDSLAAPSPPETANAQNDLGAVRRRIGDLRKTISTGL